MTYSRTAPPSPAVEGAPLMNPTDLAAEDAELTRLLRLEGPMNLRKAMPAR